MPYGNYCKYQKEWLYIHYLHLCSQVLQLLQAADITENFENISQECITGDILVELDDDVLNFELGITKRVQRLKLLRIIDGMQPVTQFIKFEEGLRKMER